MLIIGRKLKQGIAIRAVGGDAVLKEGEEIRVVVLPHSRSGRDRVSLGVQAPEAFVIRRTEGHDDD